MLKLLKLLKAYKKESILSPVFKLVEVAFELTIPLLVANIIDVGIGTGNKPYIVKMCALMGLFGVLGLACTLAAQYCISTLFKRACASRQLTKVYSPEKMGYLLLSIDGDNTKRMKKERSELAYAEC